MTHPLTPYIRLAYNTWRTADDPSHVVLILHGTDGVTIYALSPIDAQIALAELADIEALARLAVTIGTSPGDGRFWVLYLLPEQCGLAAFKWKEHVARLSN